MKKKRVIGDKCINAVVTLFKVNNKDTRTTSIENVCLFRLEQFFKLLKVKSPRQQGKRR